MSNDISEALGGDFDAESIPIPSYEPIPPGWYAAEIDKAEVRDTKAGTGKYLKLELVILDEAHNVANSTAARTKRYKRYLDLHQPKQVAMSGIDVPVQITQVVAGCVFPVIRKLDSRTRLGRSALRHQRTAKDLLRHDREVFEASQEVGGKEHVTTANLLRRLPVRFPELRQ